MGANGGTPSVHADELDAVTLLAKGCIRRVDRRVCSLEVSMMREPSAERPNAPLPWKGFGSFALPADQLPSGSHDVALVRIESIYFFFAEGLCHLVHLEYNRHRIQLSDLQCRLPVRDPA